MQSGLNLCAEVSSVPTLAFSCLMLQEKDLAYITTYSHDTEAVQMSQYSLDAFFSQSNLDKKWHSWNDSWGFPFFRVSQVIPCTALWDMLLLASVHRFDPFSILGVCFLKILLRQLDIGQVY